MKVIQAGLLFLLKSYDCLPLQCILITLDLQCLPHCIGWCSEGTLGKSLATLTLDSDTVV